VVIVTDSKSAIQSLLSPRKVSEVRKDCWDILVLLKDRHQKTNSTVSLQWVPSHRGIAGNEHVDTLAGDARDKPRAGPQCIEFGELQKEIQRLSVKKWQERWDSAPQGRFRYEVDPLLHKGRISWKHRDNEVFFTRMRLGVVKTPDWRNLILREGSGLCQRGCNEVDIEEIDDVELVNTAVRDNLRHIR